MIRHIVAAALVAGVSIVPVSADLRYTMSVMARPSTVASTGPPNPFLAMLGTLVVGTLAPAGGVESTAIIGDAGARFEYDKPYAFVPAGGAMIVHPDGSVIVINPAEKSYWRMTRSSAAAAAPAPSITIERTGTFETIAGVRAERAAVDLRVALPIPKDAAMPGMPADIAITAEAWLADDYKKYAAMASSFSAVLGSPGANPLATAGFPMRTIMRGDLFGAQEIESLVLTIGEVTAPPGTFDVPAGFTEVAPPRGGLPAMTPGR
jgi:hypothetical protein